MQVAVFALLALASVPCTDAVRARQSIASGANPIRKVVNLLQAMQKKVTEEGEAERKLYQKFKCYCENGGKDLSSSISAAEAKVPAVGSNIEEAEEKLVQTKQALKDAQSDKSDAKDAMAKATAIREKEAAAYAAEKADYDANIAAIAKAVAALEKGVAGSFLQSPAAQVLRQLALGKQDMLDVDRQELVSFLSGSQEYSPKSGQIIGILKEMGDTMAKSLAEATAQEEAAIKSYEDLMAAKAKEVGALTASVEAKTKQIGELGVAIVQMKEDLSDTEAALLEDQKFLAGLEKSCATKAAEWQERSKTRAEELVALAETIKVLNDDDALELFKKTLPSASSFMQLEVSAGRKRVLESLRSLRSSASSQERPGLDLLVLALSGKRGMSQKGFEKVIKMIDNMVEVLKKEQQDDDQKKEYCAIQLDQADDKKKALERSLSDSETAIATTKDGIATLADAIAALEAGIAALDKSVAEATEQRKEEHSEYKELMASDAAAKELLVFAMNRLNKFYNPKMYKAPAKAELSAEGRIYTNLGGDIPTEAPGGIAGTGVTAFAQVASHSMRRDAPAPPPETWDAYSKKHQENSGVISMITLLIKDLEKEMAEAETEEKDSQSDYEMMMKDSAEKRVEDSKSLSNKEAAKADLEGDLVQHTEDKKDTTGELMATVKHIESLHSECDWLLKYAEMRKEARAGEIDSLTKAKAILSGSDYSLLQTTP